jgi:hypothetical protein
MRQVVPFLPPPPRGGLPERSSSRGGKSPGLAWRALAAVTPSLPAAPEAGARWNEADPLPARKERCRGVARGDTKGELTYVRNHPSLWD